MKVLSIREFLTFLLAFCARLVSETIEWTCFEFIGLGFENGATVKQTQVVRAGLEPGNSGLQVRCPNHQATPPTKYLTSCVQGRSSRYQESLPARLC